jgi:putative NIF3 family GTP cyclohydrolase 1 type 2
MASPFDLSSIEPIEGSGRLLMFRKALSLVEVTRTLQTHLDLPYLRIGSPPGPSRKIRTLALCPGAGASLLKEVAVDAVFTGEIKHHDALHFQRHGTHVLVSEHGHTERPYLHILRKRLLQKLPKGVRVEVSRRDREPLTLWQPDA